MPRTTLDSVRAVLTTTLSDTLVNSCITAANWLVTQKLGDKAELDETILTEIEMWLAAHIASVRGEGDAGLGGLTMSEGLANVSYGVDPDISNLESTPYGRNACLLDITNTLIQLGSRVKKPSLRVISNL